MARSEWMNFEIKSMAVNWGEGGGHGVKIVPKDGCTGLFKNLRKF